MFETTVHFQTNFEKKYPSLPRPGGAAGGGARGILIKVVRKWTVVSNICLKMDLFSNICLKIDHIWLILFSNSPLGQFFKLSPFSRGCKLPSVSSTLPLATVVLAVAVAVAVVALVVVA